MEIYDNWFNNEIIDACERKKILSWDTINRFLFASQRVRFKTLFFFNLAILVRLSLWSKEANSDSAKL